MKQNSPQNKRGMKSLTVKILLLNLAKNLSAITKNLIGNRPSLGTVALLCDVND